MDDHNNATHSLFPIFWSSLSCGLNLYNLYKYKVQMFQRAGDLSKLPADIITRASLRLF
ncbi:hypothetical protein BT93_C1206 [Corymbia citriodora subsp. variegata]|nr:hypothetical protein BT93_C1206 [Corymbia citriodora subsp. variegata]